MRYEGFNGSIETTDTTVTILRDNGLGRINYGRDIPPQVIALSAVTDVRFLPATRLANGYLQVVLGGEATPEPSTVLASASTVVFSDKWSAAFAELHRWLRQVAERNQSALLSR